MVVTHINTTDTGGAFIACTRLHKGLLQQNIDSNLLTLYKTKVGVSNHEAFKRYDYSLLERVSHRWKRFQLSREESAQKKGKMPHYEGISPMKAEHQIQLHSLVQQADILHLHWLNGLVDFPSFFSQNNKPIVWTLHDLNPLTGGCHYAWDCKKFNLQCGDCPQLSPDLRKEKDVTYKNILLKKELFAKQNIYVVGNSNWTTKQAQESSAFQNAKIIKTIPLGIDTNIFTPQNKKAARELLQIPDDYTVIAFSAVYVDEIRKGLKYLLDAIEFLSQKYTIFCLSFGGGTFPFTNQNENISQNNLGKIESETLQSVVYNAADIFVIPSLQESFGQTSLEAMACGVPVVGSNVGGIPDMVKDGQTGYLVPPADSKAIAEALEKMILSPEKRLQMGKQARELVENNFTLSLQAQRYIALYQQILQK